MNGIWLRLYVAVIDDIHLQTLPPAVFKTLINCWCLAKKNNGALPPIPEMAWILRRQPNELNGEIQTLLDNGFLIETDGLLRPKNWDIHQYTSDNSTERVRRFRAKCNTQRETLHETVSRNVSETAQNRAEKRRTEREVAVPATSAQARRAPARFSPPTAEQVAKYASETGLQLDAEGFTDYHSSRGWMVGRSPMKDWKAAVRTWSRRDAADPNSRMPAHTSSAVSLNDAVAAALRGNKC